MESGKSKKAVVLFSGGLDSTTALYWTADQGYQPHCLVIDYGQKHRRELQSAQRIAGYLRFPCRVIRCELPWGGSALLDKDTPIPKGRTYNEIGAGIPSTYVPARNTLFLSFALSWAEAIAAGAIVIGANQLDWSGYPDCREDFFNVFEKTMQAGTKAGVDGNPVRILTPLLKMTKAEIIRLGSRLGVPFEWTWSCYQGGETPCQECDSCLLRAKGFQEAGTSYVAGH
ncbi:MAG: 7-cyano-7-deazaguanine synthase QueC [Candidatus Omnitrophica bacterium]|nr:7-cyano-7-deazaguanine synthase QueC [Candidatus Omnitrophota bacterium]